MFPSFNLLDDSVTLVAQQERFSVIVDLEEDEIKLQVLEMAEVIG